MGGPVQCSTSTAVEENVDTKLFGTRDELRQSSSLPTSSYEMKSTPEGCTLKNKMRFVGDTVSGGNVKRRVEEIESLEVLITGTECKEKQTCGEVQTTAEV